MGRVCSDLIQLLGDTLHLITKKDVDKYPEGRLYEKQHVQCALGFFFYPFVSLC